MNAPYKIYVKLMSNGKRNIIFVEYYSSFLSRNCQERHQRQKEHQWFLIIPHGVIGLIALLSKSVIKLPFKFSIRKISLPNSSEKIFLLPTTSFSMHSPFKSFRLYLFYLSYFKYVYPWNILNQTSILQYNERK